MESHGSVTQLIEQLKAGDETAVTPLWDRFFRRLEVQARAMLRGVPQEEADEEDLALSAFHSFCKAVADGRFAQLANRNQLWTLLMAITKRKARDYWRRANRRKSGAKERELDLEQVADLEPTPYLAALAGDNLRWMLAILDDDKLRRVALLKIEGYTDKEIAARLSCSVRTVERRLECIRRIWLLEGMR
jgi:RNA polymerase sigma factor (sigma-70 family)